MDRTAEILAAIAAIPPEPAWTLPPPPEGMRWQTKPSTPIELREATDGPWTPETRPHLKAVISYLETPEARDAVARLAAIKPGECRLTSAAMKGLRRAYRLLTAHARYEHAERGDGDAAIHDLLAVLRWSATCYRSGNYLVHITAHDMEMDDESQIMTMVFERHLTRAQADRLITTMRSTLPDSPTAWQYEVDMKVNNLTRILDLTYTRDNGGNGWLVLSRLNTVFMSPQLAPEPRVGIWNALSPLFNDRRMVAAKIERIRHTLERVSDSKFAKTYDELGRMKTHCAFNLMDGPLANGSMIQFSQYDFQQLIARTAAYRAALVAIALSAYRGEHGQYPEFLAALVDTYLDAIPLDPYDDRPLRYIPKPAEDDFVLYAVGRDQVDDHGRPVERRLGSTETPRGDVVFPHTRRDDLYAEIKLEKARP